MICFLVLMENNGGLIEKSPDYVGEKTYLLKIGHDAFGALDIYNMRKVKEWCDTWKVEMPKECADYLASSEEAFEELKARGFPGL